MPQPILLTAAREDAEYIVANLSGHKKNILHTPLEMYVPREDDPAFSETLETMDRFENIVYSSKRNAMFFLEQVKKHRELGAINECLNLAVDKRTFNFLESRGIPAVHPQNGSESIDLVELMLRLQRLDATLYPCGSHEREDFPGFLKELDIPVTELDVFDLEGPSKNDLNRYQQEVAEKQPGTVIFHSRRSVNRTLAAFPDFDYSSARIISAAKGITKKLDEKGLSADAEAGGSWKSVAELI